MVYAKYIKRDGKRFGPYYYKSVRTKDGKVKNVYIGTKLPKKKKQKQQKKVTLQKLNSTTNSISPTIYSRVLAISAILIISLLFLNVYFEKTGISTLSSFSLSQKLHYTSFTGYENPSLLTGYTIYAGGGGNNSNMTLWDETDEDLGSNATKFINHQIDFFVNYANSTDGVSINGTNISCKIRFNITGTYTDYINMSFNNSSLLYEYNRSFQTTETLDWNVYCNGTEQSYDNLNATDTTTISTLILTNPQPTTSQTSQSFLLSVKSSGEVNCKYSINQNVSYNDMGNFMTEVNDTEDLHHAPLTVSSGDTYNVYFTCKDLIGNNYAYSNTSFYVDSIAPYITATAPEGTQTTTSVTIYANTSTNADCKYSTTDTNFSNMGATMTGAGTTEHNATPTSTQGLNTYYIRCNDSFGNTMTSSALILFEVDSISPTSPSLISPANDSYQNQTPTFSWGASSSAVNYTINITNSTDDVVNLTTTNLTTFTPQTLSEDTYTWKVRATDSAGNTGDWSTLRTFIIDTSAPPLSNPLPLTNQSSRTFLVSVNGSETGLTCKFDPTISTYDEMGYYMTDLGTNIYQSYLTVPSDGSYTIYFACQDSAGNIETTNTGEFNVDSIAPYITATSPLGLQNSTSTTIYSNTSTSATCKYSTTDTNFSNMGATMTGAGTTEHNATPTSTQGLNTYYIRCNDSFGNTMTSSALIIFWVDSIAPEAPLLISPTNNTYTNDSSPLLTWSSVADADFYILTIDNSEYTINQTSYAPSPGASLHNWSVKAQDKTNNTSPDSELWFFTIDSTPPTLSSPLPTTTQTSRSFIVSVNATESDLTCKYSLNADVDFSAMGFFLTDLENNKYQSTLTVPQEGSHTIYFACQDSAGNINTTNTSSFIVDSTAPTITASSPDGYTTSSQNLTLTTDVSAVCKYDTSDKNFLQMANTFGSAKISHSVNASPYIEGLNIFYVRCNDSYGNIMSSSIMIDFYLDSNSPSI